MFSSLGLFKHVDCPKQDDCSLPACIFSHAQPSQVIAEADTAIEYDPLSAGALLSPPSKRRKIDHDTTLPENGTIADLTMPYSFRGPPVASNQHSQPALKRNVQARAETSNSTQAKSAEPIISKPKSIVRPISPPPVKHKLKPPDCNTENGTKVKAESLTPRIVPKPPVLLKNRLTILQSLHQQMIVQNKKLINGDPKLKALVLSDQELVKFALDEEEDAARKLEADIYRNAITQRILKFKKMSEEEWRALVRERIDKQVNPFKVAPVSTGAMNKITTGLNSAEEELAVLRHLRTPLEGLEKHGYVSAQPSDKAVSEAKASVEAAAGWESCNRCGTRFQVFSGRDENGRLTTRGPCRYHWARINRNAPQKTDRVTGQAQSAFSCCNQPMGSEGCTECETHVFKVSSENRLASVLQFEHTPAKGEMRRKSPVSFDCEMGYTTLGLEVIRVTAVSWPAGKELLDVLVRPYGEILDLNTRFSGVSKEQFAAATPYNAEPADHGDGTSDEGGLVPGLLRKVESPAAARELLFDLLTPDTPLIGHAIDNDLNVVRVVHPFIIDTVLLYPHPRGLPIRYSLKVLTSKHLNRGIQMGGEAGHDSKEDAIATGDLVTKRVAEKWKSMQLEGWTFEDGMLVAPEEVTKTLTAPKAAL